MAKKKKKKKNPVAEQKQQQLQYKKDFLQRLAKVCIAIESIELYNMLPQKLKEELYYFRGTSLKVKGPKGVRLKRSVIDFIEKNINSELTKIDMELTPGSGRTVSFADFFRIVYPFNYFIDREHTPFDGMEKFKACAERGMDMMEDYMHEMNKMMLNLLIYSSDPRDEFLYVGKYQLHVNSPFSETGKLLINLTKDAMSSAFQTRQELIVDKYPLETRTFTINGETRRAIRYGFMNNISMFKEEVKMIPIDIPMKLLDEKNIFGDLLIPVYIQKHAIDRMTERLCRLPYEPYIYIVASILLPEVVSLGDNKYRIAYYYQGLKAGYLIATYIDGCLLIRTFLFLTNSGTPEGKRLEEQTGLLRAEKEYFAIDTLGSLMYSNLLENEEICRMFINAGCESILELCKKELDVDYRKFLPQTHKDFRPELLLDYINKMKDDEEYIEF